MMASEGDNVRELPMSGALSAIHEEALRLLEYEMPKEVREGLALIISIARHQADVRNEAERSAG